MSSLVRNKKFLIPALLAAGLVAASLAAATSFASAQNTTNLPGNNSSNNGTQGVMPPANNNTQAATTGKIVGSISIKQATKDFLNEKVKVTLAEASSKAASQANGTAVKGRLGIVQGYLVYTITVANMNNETLQKVIVDAGNGSVLYTSPARQAGHSVLGMVDGYFEHGMHDHHHRHHHHHHHDY